MLCRTGPPSRRKTGRFAALPAMSHIACSSALIAVKWAAPFHGASRFIVTQLSSMSRGSLPMIAREHSWIAPSADSSLLSSVASPTPLMPSSVSIRTKRKFELCAAQPNVLTSVIFMNRFPLPTGETDGGKQLSANHAAWFIPPLWEVYPERRDDPFHVEGRRGSLAPSASARIRGPTTCARSRSRGPDDPAP